MLTPKKYILLLMTSLLAFTVAAQDLKPLHLANPSDVTPVLKNKLQENSSEARLIDSILNTLTLKEKIAQLYIVEFSSRQSKEKKKELMNLIKKEKIGGLILMYDSLSGSAPWINDLKRNATIPLLMTIDAEWGLAMRLREDLDPYPRQIQLGALPSDILISEMGLSVGHQLRRFGIEVNFAPSVDINTNIKNPVIHSRSFGDNKVSVARYATAYMRGMQEGGVLTSAKHFPGHGDTETDSHYSLPILPFSRERLNDTELYSFRELIKNGVDMVMIGHLNIPALDDTGTPSSLSYNIITKLLREEMGYEGIIITDALNMKGVSKHLKPKEIPLAALKAGCDIILMPEEVEKSIKVITKAVRRGKISRQEIDKRCRKILEAKYRTGLITESGYERHYIDMNDLAVDLEKIYDRDLMLDISRESITVLGDNSSQLIGRELREGNIALLSIFKDETSKVAREFSELVSQYSNTDLYSLSGDFSVQDMDNLLNRLSGYKKIIIANHNSDYRPAQKYGIVEWQARALEKWSTSDDNREVIKIFFGVPFALQHIDYNKFDAFIISYSNSKENIKATAEILFGDIKPKGKLPITIREE